MEANAKYDYYQKYLFLEYFQNQKNDVIELYSKGINLDNFIDHYLTHLEIFKNNIDTLLDGTKDNILTNGYYFISHEYKDSFPNYVYQRTIFDTNFANLIESIYNYFVVNVLKDDLKAITELGHKIFSLKFGLAKTREAKTIRSIFDEKIIPFAGYYYSLLRENKGSKIRERMEVIALIYYLSFLKTRQLNLNNIPSCVIDALADFDEVKKFKTFHKYLIKIILKDDYSKINSLINNTYKQYNVGKRADDLYHMIIEENKFEINN